MLLWRAEYGQSVPHKTVQSMSVKNYPFALPVVVYQLADSKEYQINVINMVQTEYNTSSVSLNYY